jgi:predicted RNA polymerase sigma factor
VGDGDAAATLDLAAVARIFREESGRSVATMIRVVGDIDVAEDAVQEAFAVAVHKWPVGKDSREDVYSESMPP